MSRASSRTLQAAHECPPDRTLTVPAALDREPHAGHEVVMSVGEQDGRREPVGPARVEDRPTRASSYPVVAPQGAPGEAVASSDDRRAAVDRDVRPGDVRRLVAREEEHRVGDVLGLAPLAQRHPGQDLLGRAVLAVQQRRSSAASRSSPG